MNLQHVCSFRPLKTDVNCISLDLTDACWEKSLSTDKHMKKHQDADRFVLSPFNDGRLKLL